MTDPPSPKSPADSRLAPGRLMASSCAAMIVFGAGIAVPSVCLRAVGDEFELNFAQRGLLGSVMMASLVCSLLLVGHLADRFGKRGFLAWGMIVIAVGTVATAQAMSYVFLLLARALTGAGKGVMEALVNPLVAELDPDNAARRLNIVNGVFAVGLVVAAVLTGELLEAGVSWRVAFWLWVPPTLAVGVMFSARGYPPPLPAAQRAGQGRRFVSDPLFWLLFGAMVMGGGCEAGMTLWGANFVEHELGASPRGGALTIGLYGAFMALGRFGSSWLVGRIHPVVLMMASAALCAATTLGLSFVEGLHAVWALFALGGLFVACFWPTLLSVASENIAVGSSTLFALLAAGGILGCVVFPWGMGALADVAGLRVGVALLPASMLAEVALLIAMWRLIARRGDRPDER